MSRRKLIAANWKMNKSIAEAVAFAPPLRAALPRLSSADLVLLPSFFGVRPLADALAGTAVAIGAQDLYHEKEGAFTGEVSGAMVADAGASFVLVGHSERRHVLGENDELVARKFAAAIHSGLTPILCVGELLAERDAGLQSVVVEKQLASAFSELEPALASRAVVAYEPVWAIGTGRTASPDDASDMHAAVRAWLLEQFGEAAGEMRILYGGSVKPDNTAGLAARENVDGFLVGGASLEAASFVAIAAAAVAARAD
jgi:triosephosphate isomerase (TIM)